jgi:hypothetical protein
VVKAGRDWHAPQLWMILTCGPAEFKWMGKIDRRKKMLLYTDSV